MILVTGSTGLVGAHLLYKLTQQDKPIKALYRKEHKLNYVKRVFSYYTKDVEKCFNTIKWVKGSILDIPFLDELLEYVTHVYHCAALVSFNPKDYKVLKKTNIEGTANMVNMALHHNATKFCYVSSIATLSEGINNSLINEENYWNPDEKNNVYAISKYGAEMEVWRATQEGLNAVIVNPGVIIGGGFWHYGSSNLFKKVYNGLTYYTNGSVGFVDVEDVVKAMLQLMNSTIVNERFILVSKNWSYKQFLQTSATYLGVKPPKKEARLWLLTFASKLDWVRATLFGKRRQLTKGIVKSLTTASKYSNVKIKNQLGFKFKPLEASIKTIAKQYLEDLKQ